MKSNSFARNIASAREKFLSAERAIKKNALTLESPEALISLGRIYLSLSRLDEARDHFSRAVALEKWNRWPKIGLALVALEEQDLSSASKWTREAKSFRDFDLQLQTLWGHVLTRQGKFYEAESVFRKIVATSSGCIEGYLGLATALWKLADFSGRPLFEDIVQSLTMVLNLSLVGRGSIRLSEKEKSAIFYARACARAKTIVHKDSTNQSEIVGLIRSDLTSAIELDEGNFAAKRSKEFVPSRASFVTTRFVDIVGFLLAIFALLILGKTTGDIFYGTKVGATELQGVLSLLSIGVLVSAPFLRTIVKIKLGGLELEKAVERAADMSASIQIEDHFERVISSVFTRLQFPVYSILSAKKKITIPEGDDSTGTLPIGLKPS